MQYHYWRLFLDKPSILTGPTELSELLDDATIATNARSTRASEYHIVSHTFDKVPARTMRDRWNVVRGRRPYTCDLLLELDPELISPLNIAFRDRDIKIINTFTPLSATVTLDATKKTDANYTVEDAKKQSKRLEDEAVEILKSAPKALLRQQGVFADTYDTVGFGGRVNATATLEGSIRPTHQATQLLKSVFENARYDVSVRAIYQGRNGDPQLAPVTQVSSQ